MGALEFIRCTFALVLFIRSSVLLGVDWREMEMLRNNRRTLDLLLLHIVCSSDPCYGEST